MISFPFWVQTGLEAEISEVRRLGSARVLKSSERSSRYKSLDPAQREKASVCPSGEKAGPLSPSPFAGGEVSLRFSPVSIE